MNERSFIVKSGWMFLAAVEDQSKLLPISPPAHAARDVDRFRVDDKLSRSRARVAQW